LHRTKKKYKIFKLGVGEVTSKIWFGGKKLRGGMGDMGGLFFRFH